MRDYWRHNQRQDPERPTGRVRKCSRHGVGNRIADYHEAGIDFNGAAKPCLLGRVTVVTGQLPCAAARCQALANMAAGTLRNNNDVRLPH